MKLIYAAASPFARKVRVLASEIGLLDSIEMIDTAVLPIKANDMVNQLNPLAKIPVLLTTTGESLYDSRVICEYLDSLHAGPTLFPQEPTARWTALKLAALADGLMDAALLVRYENAVRPQELQWDDWKSGQLDKVTRALQALEDSSADLSGPLDIAQISVACALGYLDFRFPELAWRQDRPKLQAFHAAFSDRESMRTSAPV
ncbi:MAG: glutathione S-transferase N-terminal domain-containing protein [Pseudomonas sp.]|uniref:glutathione S-transferase N-terminal domain-containing protein n=1 Tax=Pseudomonas sp. TaxID=306 RepID=UPI002735261E|nr:glutathione S-transferase N-terminal domain-containing protein [Pseudomonas sp.]MDP3845588.1 glutathione S-transferase N-terminal domain-containing protein [Pseudomonas sp.]